jgi:hypothetical protein
MIKFKPLCARCSEKNVLGISMMPLHFCKEHWKEYTDSMADFLKHGGRL